MPLDKSDQKPFTEVKPLPVESLGSGAANKAIKKVKAKQQEKKDIIDKMFKR